jgi:signal transduction histidine kinase
MTRYPASIALLCDEWGNIHKVIRNDLKLDGLTAGQPLRQCVDLGSRVKLLDFLLELRGEGAALDWEINFPQAGQPVTLHLAGVTGQDGLMIAGAFTPHEALNLLSELVKTSPAQTAALQMALHDSMQAPRQQIEADGSLYDEITRLNNELVTLQRDLAKKNVVMEHLNAEVRQLNQELDRRLAERTAQLDLANQELAATSYSLAHTLKTPLRALNNFAYFIEQDYHHLLDEQALDYLNRIRTASHQMDQVTDDLLRLLSIANRGLEIAPLDLSALVRQNMHQLSASNPARLFEFICPDQLILSADPYLMNILIANLLNNAWKFTQNRQPARIEFGTILQDDRPVFFIRDNGVGFDMAYVGRLFGNFEKLHPLAEFEGAGIGLAIVRLIIQKHNGQVWAEGKIDQGAAFYFTLPAAPA